MISSTLFHAIEDIRLIQVHSPHAYASSENQIHHILVVMEALRVCLDNPRRIEAVKRLRRALSDLDVGEVEAALQEVKRMET